MPIKPSELNPNFLKKIEDKYGPISPDDFFSDDLETYFKADDPSERGEGGGVTSTVIRLPSFVKLFKTLDNARDIAKDLTTQKDLRGDEDYKEQYKKVLDTFNAFRKFLNSQGKNLPRESSFRNRYLSVLDFRSQLGWRYFNYNSWYSVRW